MTDLAEIVDNLAVGDTHAPDPVGLRHGWATEQVVAAMSEAGTAMSAAEIRTTVATRNGRDIRHSTVRYILRYGGWARSGRIVNEAAGYYRLA